MRRKSRWTRAGMLIGLLVMIGTGVDAASPADPPPTTQRAADRRYVVDSNGNRSTPVVGAIDACAWPILVQAPDGAILAAVFNRPSHGRMVGGIDVYASTDGGATWSKRATAASPEPGAKHNRINIAFDRLPSGELMLVCSGWTLKDAPESPSGLEIDYVIPARIYRSADSGKTWHADPDAFPHLGPQGSPLVPYGSIRVAKDGSLIVSAYSTAQNDNRKFRQTYVVRGTPDGKTWEVGPAVDPKTSLNETYTWHDGAGRWLAAARGRQLDVYESTDDARTWRHLSQATELNAIPGMILKLADGRLLLSHGNRTKDDQRVEVRISDDAGKTWSEPVRITDHIGFDGGYPSSVQRDDGMIVTGYYAKQTEYHDGYHFGIVTWDPARTFPGK